MIYVAVPYSSDDPAVMQHRFNVVTKVSAALMKRGKMVFSPITHSHPIAQYLDAKTALDWKAWQKFDTKMLKCCDELYVLMLAGWLDSVGVGAEMQLARELGMKITFIDERLKQYAWEDCK